MRGYGKHVAGSRKEVVIPEPIPYVRLTLFSVVFGFILEAGQLFGAPFASVLNLDDWSKKAVLIYVILSFLVGWLALRFNWMMRAREALACVKEFMRCYGRILFMCAVVSVISTVFVDAVITVFSGFSEPLPLGLFLFSFFFTASLVVAFREFIARKTEWFFLVCILTLGIGFIALSPIETSYSFDDQIHYGNATALSYLDNRAFSQSDRFLLELGYKDPYDPDGEGYEVEELLESCEDFQEGAYIPLDEYNQSSLYKSSLSSYTSLGYIPSAVGLYLGRLLHLPYALVFDFGKLFNLLFFSLIVFMGMRKLLSKKTIACAVMLLPAAVFLACNYTYDTWLIGLLFYAFASFVGLLQSGKTINKADMVKILAAFLLGLGPKAIYFPLLFLLLLIPKNQFDGNISIRGFRIAVVGSALFALASFALPMLVGGVGTDTRINTEANSGDQIRGILADPLGYCGVMVSFASFYLSPAAAGGYTTLLGYLGPLVDLTPLFYAWLLVSALLDDGLEENRSFANAKYALFCLAAAVCSLVGIFSALYITFTPVGSSTIAGVQGRYLIPLLFPFLAFCLNFKLPRIISRETACLVSFSVSALGFYVVFLAKFVSLWVG